MDPYRFVKVEEFFGSIDRWSSFGPVLSKNWEQETLTLTITLQKPGSPEPGTMQLLVLQQNLFRVRINPGKLSADEFTRAQTRTVVQDTVDDLRRILEERLPFTVDKTEPGPNQVVLTTAPVASSSTETRPTLRIVVDLAPLQITVFDSSAAGGRSPVWQTATPGILYTPNGSQDYCIIQAVNNPPAARYVGFGAQGGSKLVRKEAQLGYFNYDNMRYQEVYKPSGPWNDREPLYHSDPFFIAFDGSTEGTEGVNSVYGLFVDNVGQVCIDIATQQLLPGENKYLLGSRFNDLDYYFVLGAQPAEVLTDFTALVGRSGLKPRYVLGYHQGCFGYKSRKTVERIADRYFKNEIPLDGLAIDVDIQRNYKTFTINRDPDRFNNPKQMFQKLRDEFGVKCCTNITPIISLESPQDYTTYQEGLSRGYFVKDIRFEVQPKERQNPAEFYDGGTLKKIPYDNWQQRSKDNCDSGKPYIGQVWYGGDQKTAGHYPDLGVKDVRIWWGEQYKHLFEQGLEFVWQDMTTPAIPVEKDKADNPIGAFGDMKGFPYRLMLTDDFLSGAASPHCMFLSYSSLHSLLAQLALLHLPKEEAELPKSMAVKVWNLYSYNLHKATYHGLNFLESRQGKEPGQNGPLRNFIIGRGCYSGMHRFAALWTGDNASEWEFLKINIAQVLALGLCGQALSGQDIGGFESHDDEEWADPALLIRWTIAGAFLPWFRNHYHGGRKLFQEPFNFVEWFQTAEARNRGFRDLPEPKDLYRKVVPICRYYIRLRYRLLQLFYDHMWQNMLDGLPICRPLFLNDPQDKALLNDKKDFCSDQFFVGRDLLVAPVLDPESDKGGKRKVYLPAGQSRWYCFMDNQLPLAASVAGGTTIPDFDASLRFDHERDQMHLRFLCPLYVRAGGVLPTIPQEQFVGQLNKAGKPCPITFNIYPGRQGEYKTYLDDGKSRASAPADAPQFKYSYEAQLGIAKSEYRRTQLQHKLSADGALRIVTLERLHDNYRPPFEDHFYVALLHDPDEKSTTGTSSSPLLSVKVGNIEAAEVRDRQALEAAAGDAWWFDPVAKVTYIKVQDSARLIKIQAKYVSRVPWA
eukprot:gene12727-12857_t